MGDGLKALGGVSKRLKMEALESKVEAMGKELGRLSSGKSKDALLTSKEIAPHVGVTHHKTVERWVREQGLPCVRVGRNLRFRLGDVLRWLAQRKER